MVERLQFGIIGIKGQQRFDKQERYYFMKRIRIWFGLIILVLGIALATGFYFRSPRSFDPPKEIIKPNSVNQISLILELKDTSSVEFASNTDGSLLAIGGESGVAIWDIIKGKKLEFLKHISGGLFSRPVESIRAIALSPNGELLASASFEERVEFAKLGSLKLWDIEDGSLIREIAHDLVVGDIAFDPTSSLLAYSEINLHNSNKIHIVDINANQETATFDSVSLVDKITFNSDGTLLAYPNGTDVELWQLETHEQRMLVGRSGIPLWSVNFSPDGRLLVAWGPYNTALVWDVETGLILYALKDHDLRINRVIFNSDATLIASCSDDNTIRLWDAQNGDVLMILMGHGERVSSIDFSPDNEMLVSGSWDRTVRLWDISNGDELRLLQDDSVIFNVIFSDDGKLIVASSELGTKFWGIK